MSEHDYDTLLNSYNSQCPDCRRTIHAITEIDAIDILATEVARVQRELGKARSRIRLNNAIAIYQRAVKHAARQRKAS